MTQIMTTEDIMDILHDMEKRSQHDGTRLSQQSTQRGSWSAISFKLADRTYLIPLDEVKEIFPPPSQITPVPCSAGWLLGAANIHGEILPLFDLGFFLLQQTTPLIHSNRIVVIEHHDYYFGLLVGQTSGLKHFKTPPTPTTHLDDDNVVIANYLTGQVSQQEITWQVFSPHQLLNDSRFINTASND